jgi:hypothetical protein
MTAATAASMRRGESMVSLDKPGAAGVLAQDRVGVVP